MNQLKIFTKKRFFIIFILLILLLLSFFLDQSVLTITEEMRIKALNNAVIALSKLGPGIGATLLIIFLFFRKNWKKIFLLIMSFIAALELGYLAKSVFNIPRPYQLFEIANLTTAKFSSFPSMHSAFVFAALPFFNDELKKYRYPWIFFSLMIAWSRLYLSVHFFSDVVAGALLGFFVGFLIKLLQEKYHFIEKMVEHPSGIFEIRRQFGHALTGVIIVGLIYFGYIDASILAAILVLGGLLSFIAKKQTVPLLHRVLACFERPHHMKNFPGKGSFFMVLGALLALVTFPQNIALASIIIMAIGDSVTNIVGGYFGKRHYFYNQKKKIEGTITGIILATLAANIFLPIFPAFLGSMAGMLVESLSLKIGRFELDDNVVIPLVAGWTIILIL
ncbi:phosphatase PAP2 family protein [Candidatus Peregrinibacteria bacterium]|nr:phosphatase PAP2 family protein [Candidatus Peregrinibacteria bacterium]